MFSIQTITDKYYVIVKCTYWIMIGLLPDTYLHTKIVIGLVFLANIYSQVCTAKMPLHIYNGGFYLHRTELSHYVLLLCIQRKLSQSSDLTGLYWRGFGSAGWVCVWTQFSFQEHLLGAGVAPHSQSGQIHCQVVPRLLEEKGTVLSWTCEWK